MSQAFRTRVAHIFQPNRKKGVSILMVALFLFGLWYLSPIQSVQALASLTDPDKLATLSEQDANIRMNKIVFYLHEIRAKGVTPERAIRWAHWLNGTKEPRATLVKESLLRNLKIADELLLFTPANRERLRRGLAAKVVRGPYAGETTEIDPIVPLNLASEVRNELANLEMVPQTVSRKKSNYLTTRQLSHAQRLFEAGLLKQESLQRIRDQSQKSPHQSETLRPYLLQ